MVAGLVTGRSVFARKRIISLIITLPNFHAPKWRACRWWMASVPEQRGGEVAFTAGLPLLPLDSSEVVGAGTVLHSQHAATTGVQGVILCLVGLGSTKEK